VAIEVVGTERAAGMSKLHVKTLVIARNACIPALASNPLLADWIASMFATTELRMISSSRGSL